MTKYADNNNFDFSDTSITKEEYYNKLDSMHDLEWVDTINHSCALNKIILKSKILTDDFNIDFMIEDINKDMIIRNIFIEDNRLEVRINTSKWLVQKEDKDKYFPGEYTDEAIQYLYAELQLMTNFENIKIVENKSELEVKIEDSISNIDKIEDIFSYIGFSVSRFTVKNKVIKSIYLTFNESTVFNQESIEKFQDHKYEQVIKNIKNNSTPVELPSGHKSKPDILMISDCDNSTIKEFPVEIISAPPETNKETMKVHKIHVEDVIDVFLTVSDWYDIEPVEKEEKFTATTIQDGYVCPETNTIYVIPQNSNIFRNIINKEDYINTYTVEYNNTEKSFSLFNYN